VVLKTAKLLPIVMESEFLAGRLGLAPTVQVISVESTAVGLAQGTPSMRTEMAAEKSRLVPEMLRVYPPKMSPYLGEKEVTMAVLESAYVAFPFKVILLNPSSYSTSEGCAAKLAILIPL
jgi:hypothetical protein